MSKSGRRSPGGDSSDTVDDGYRSTRDLEAVHIERHGEDGSTAGVQEMSGRHIKGIASAFDQRSSFTVGKHSNGDLGVVPHVQGRSDADLAGGAYGKQYSAASREQGWSLQGFAALRLHESFGSTAVR
jgi:hypothetical protein